MEQHPPHRRRYSDADRANALAALDANAGNLKRTAGELDIPESTLDGWAKGRRNPVDPELRDEKRRDLAAALEDVALRLAGALELAAGTMAPKDAAVALGITVDKLLLLRGRPNAITAASPPPPPDLSRLSIDDLRQFLALYRRTAALPPADGGPADRRIGPPEPG